MLARWITINSLPKNGLSFYTPDWEAPSWVKAYTTTRFGGVSKGTYQSLNLATHVGDDDKDVHDNRQLLREALDLPSEPIWLDQVHGLNIIELTGSSAFATSPMADGAYTKQQKTVCAVLTADCLPLFLTDKQGSQVAIIHAGWRGLANGIIERGVENMQSARSDIVAWAGPCIGPEEFEIGSDVKQQIGGSHSAYRASNNPDKYYANLYQLSRERLASVGVKHFSHSEQCTYQNNQDFFSYRRSGQCGRIASLIWIEK